MEDRGDVLDGTFGSGDNEDRLQLKYINIQTYLYFLPLADAVI